MPRTRVPPERNLQTLCADILATSVDVEGTLHWCRRVAKSTQGRPMYDAIIARLAKQGVLGKVMIGENHPLRRNVLLHAFFNERLSIVSGVQCVYTVEQRDQLEMLAKNTKAARRWLGPTVRKKPISFNQAIERVKEEILSNADPDQSFLTVLRRLYPR